MTEVFGFVSRWLAVRTLDSRGASLIEYTLLLSLIVLAALAGLSAFGLGVSGSFNDSAGRIAAAGNP